MKDKLLKPSALKKALSSVKVIGCVGLLVIFLTACSVFKKPETSQGNAAPSLAQATAEVVRGKDILLISPDLKIYVYIQSIAIKGEGVLTLTTRESDLFPEAELPRQWYRGTIANLDMFTNAGKLIDSPTFLQPIEICFVLDRNEWKQYLQDPNRYAVQYYNVNESAWLSLDASTRPEARQVCGKADHLTLFALATREPAPLEATPGELYTP